MLQRAGEALLIASGDGFTYRVSRLLLALLITLLSLDGLHDPRPDRVSAKSAVGKLAAWLARMLGRLASLGLVAWGPISGSAMRAVQLSAQAWSRLVANRQQLAAVATSPLAPLRLARQLSHGFLYSFGPDMSKQILANESVGDFAHLDKEHALQHAALLLQAFYGFRRLRNNKLRKEALLSTGSLRFRAHLQSGLRHRPARFVRTASDDRRAPRSVFQQAEAATRWLVSECGLGVPSVLISVTGGAQRLKLTPEAQQLFERGLVSAHRPVPVLVGPGTGPRYRPRRRDPPPLCPIGWLSIFHPRLRPSLCSPLLPSRPHLPSSSRLETPSLPPSMPRGCAPLASCRVSLCVCGCGRPCGDPRSRAPPRPRAPAPPLPRAPAHAGERRQDARHLDPDWWHFDGRDETRGRRHL